MMKEFTVSYEKVQEMFENYIWRMRQRQHEASGSYNEAWVSGECREMERWLEYFGVDVSYPRIQPMIEGEADTKAFDEESGDEEDEMQEVEITMEKRMRISKRFKVTDAQLEQLESGDNIFAEELESDLESGDTEYDYTVCDLDGNEIVPWED